MRPTNARIWHKAVLRWVWSQGRSPHASGKAKNTFHPVGIPLFGAPQAPDNKSTPEVGRSLGDGPLRPEEISSAEAHPAEPPRGKTAYRMRHTNALKERLRGPLYLSLRPTNARIWHKAVFKVGPVAGPKPTRVRQGQKYLRPRRYSPFWGASGPRQ